MGLHWILKNDQIQLIYLHHLYLHFHKWLVESILNTSIYKNVLKRCWICTAIKIIKIWNSCEIHSLTMFVFYLYITVYNFKDFLLWLLFLSIVKFPKSSKENFWTLWRHQLNLMTSSVPSNGGDVTSSVRIRYLAVKVMKFIHFQRVFSGKIWSKGPGRPTKTTHGS